MSTHHGKDGIVKVGANTVAEMHDWSVEENAATVDDTAMGDSADTHLVGQTNWSGQATAGFDPTDTNGQLALTVGASVTLNLYPYGSTTGKKYKTGTATVTKVGIAVPMRNQTTRTFSFQGNGALSDATAS